MKSTIYSVALTATFAIATLFASAQNFEGKVVYDIVYEEVPEEIAGFESMLPKEMTTYMKGPKTRIEQNTGMGENITIMDTDKKEGVVLMNMMGNKWAIKMSKEDIEEKEGDAEEPQFKYLKETKKIAGYTCKKAEMWIEGEEDDVMTVYYTEAIQNTANSNFKGLKGFPLEYQIAKQGMVMSMVANTVKKETVAASLFEVPDGYEEKTMEELGGMMGGK
jgi:GLPGLI family protein